MNLAYWTSSAAALRRELAVGTADRRALAWGKVTPQKARQRRELDLLGELRCRPPEGIGCQHCRPAGFSMGRSYVTEGAISAVNLAYWGSSAAALLCARSSALTVVSFYAAPVRLRIALQSAWGRPLLQGSPLPKMIRWIVFEIPPCGAPDAGGISLTAVSDQRLCLWTPQAFVKA